MQCERERIGLLFAFSGWSCDPLASRLMPPSTQVGSYPANANAGVGYTSAWPRTSWIGSRAVGGRVLAMEWRC